MRGIVLRYGAFYGPDTGMLASPVIDQIRARRLPVADDGGGWWPLLHVEDAAAAMVAMMTGSRAGANAKARREFG